MQLVKIGDKITFEMHFRPAKYTLTIITVEQVNMANEMILSNEALFTIEPPPPEPGSTPIKHDGA